MAIFGGLLDLVLVLFLVLVFAEYAKVRAKAEKQMKFVAGAALFFLLAFAFSGLSVWGMVAGAEYGTYLFEIIGWIFLLIGTLWGAIVLAQK